MEVVAVVLVLVLAVAVAVAVMEVVAVVVVMLLTRATDQAGEPGLTSSVHEHPLGQRVDHRAG